MLKTLKIAVPVLFLALVANAGEDETAPAPAAKTKSKPARVKEVPSSKDMKEMEVKEVYSSIRNGMNVVILGVANEDIFLPIWIGDTEAFAISMRIARRHAERPLTHDLLEEAIKSLDATVVKVEIDDLRESVFLGKVFLRRDGVLVELDARPSDSIALAVGAKAPIYAARKVLEAAGITGEKLLEMKEQEEKGREEIERLKEFLRSKEKGQAL